MLRKLLGRLTRLWGSFRPSSLVSLPIHLPQSLHLSPPFLSIPNHYSCSIYTTTRPLFTTESPPYHPSAGQLTANSSLSTPCSNHHSHPTPRAFSCYSS